MLEFVPKILGYMVFGISKGREGETDFFNNPKNVEESVPIIYLEI
jgi:hypothetical protein